LRKSTAKASASRNTLTIKERAAEDAIRAAVEEMPAGYDQLMIPVIDNIPVLIFVLVLTVPVAIMAMRLAERTLKKPAASLK
jgi:hypothetical protein